MRIPPHPTAAVFALCVLALPFAANAQKVTNPDQTKNVTAATAKLPAAAANVPTVPPRVSTQIVLKPATGYIGTYFALETNIIMDGGKTSPWAQWQAEESCRIEIQVADWAPMACQGFCAQPCLVAVPESKKEGAWPLKARFATFGRMLASDWKTTTLTVVKSSTKLTLGSKKSVPLPAALALVEATEEEEEVSIQMTKSFLSNTHSETLPVENRAVVVNVPGGAVDGQVPPSNKDGRITFRVLHSKGRTSQVQIAFMGDSAYQPSSVSVTVP